MLCQVEKAKEDMLNQLYSSIRLMFCTLVLWFQIVGVLEDAMTFSNFHCQSLIRYLVRKHKSHG